MPNVSWVKDINEVKYGRKVKRVATFNVSTEEYLNTNPILLYNCSGVKNIKVNGVLTGPDENNQIAVTEVGTYEVEMEFESNEINIDLFNKDTDGSWGGFNTLSELNNDFFVGIKNIPILQSPFIRTINIPDSVIFINDGAFKSCESLTSVTIGNGVTSIGSMAFSHCSNLTSVNISSLESWVNINFNNTYSNPLYWARNLYLNGQLVTDLVIPDSVTSIGNFAFHGCSGLTSITIPNSVTSIGYDAFRDCSNLTSITIPNSVTSIEFGVFYGCSNLTSVDIPNSVTSIKLYAFKDCESLSEITCYAMTAPTITSSTFQSVKTGGVLKVPTGATGYDTQWMKTSNYYLGKYNWSIEYI